MEKVGTVEDFQEEENGESSAERRDDSFHWEFHCSRPFLLHDKPVRSVQLIFFSRRGNRTRLVKGYAFGHTAGGGSRILIRVFWAGVGGGRRAQIRQLKLRMAGEFRSQASCPLSQGGCGRGGNSHQKPGARGKQGCQEMNPTQGPSSWPTL